MAVALLSPRDCLREDHRHTNLGRIYRPSAPLNFHEKKKQQQQQAKPKQETKRQQQAPRDPKRNNNYTKRNIHNNNNNKNSRFKEENANAKFIVPGQITILKRGERERDKEDTSSDSAKKITEKRNVEKIADGRTVKNAVEEWAGPAYFNSPSPRCLPLPKFQVKNSGVGYVKEGEEDVDSFATQNLRRLLGLA